MFSLIIVVLLSYLLGSVPTSIIITKALKGIDIRNYGSGNAGGTNVIRVIGWGPGVFVILFDAMKGFLAAVVLSRLFYGNFPLDNATPFSDFTVVQIIAGISAILGHTWTVFAGFKGGKGIATAGGMLVGIAPIEVAIAAGVFAVVVASSRYVSLGSVSAAVAFPLAMFVRANVFDVATKYYHSMIFFSIAISGFLIYNHRANISRLLHGREHRLEKLRFFYRAKSHHPQPGSPTNLGK
ncbi:MAG TPA: glycerol-3-phosphate 1-O-acyltransferase PlsY [Candidatus Acidoferrales bacterium]|nr:glycerol-3-phosphate 1-O-acyltransferase PlsY [Candidatus Acidoferrales bacterium]